MKKPDCLYNKVCQNECSNSCIRYIQMNRLLELSNLPKCFKTPTVIYSTESDRESYITLTDIKNDIKTFVNNGKNLYICSSTCGNGKTTWATKLMLKYFDMTWNGSYDVTRGLYVHVPTLLLDIKNFNNKPSYVDRIKDADLVIWDDLAFSGKLTEYEHEQLLMLIDNRLTSGKSNIYTSNQTNLADLTKFIGGRLASRVFNGSQIVTFYSDDFRANLGGN